ncbi:hypothetical protein QBC44DRAFT_246283 [Cladorrhinum sp. PSN332]|nr:hypothetical protein QBC44DRAFT_246283 [Cladorrhinum sp. PSN332]
MYPYPTPPPPHFEIGNANDPVYSFVSSRARSSTPSIDGAKSSDSDSLSNANPDTTTGGSLRGLQILESRYVGESLEGQNCSVGLTVAPSESTAHQPLFRWVHIKQQTLDFDEFEKQALSVAGLTPSEKQGLKSITSLIRRNFVKRIQTANGPLVPHMDPRFTQIPIPCDGNLREQTYVSRTVSWLCLPYFTLENYSGLLTAESGSAFPVETLLQAKLPRTTRERDMQQAVRQQKGTPAGLCFHVSQLWCLVVDNSLLITCGRISEEDLCLNLIEKTIKAAQGASPSKPEPKILVRYLSDVVWALPVAECKTWFAFISHFQEFWPRRILFYQYKRLVKPEQWPKIWDNAAQSKSKATLQPTAPSSPPPAHSPFKADVPVRQSEWGSTGKIPSSSDNLKLRKSQDEADNPWKNAKKVHFAPTKKTEPDPETTKEAPVFAVFTCLDGVQTSDPDHIDETVLQEVFSELNDCLLRRTTPSDRRAYCDCPGASRLEVYARLEAEGLTLTDPDMPPPTPPQRQDYEKRVELFNTADKLFKFFFPPDTEVPTVRKFWGAIRALVQGNEDIRTSRDVNMISRQRFQTALTILQQLTPDLPTFNEVFVHADVKERAKIKTPSLLLDAWVHIVLGLVNRRDEDRMYQLSSTAAGRSGLMYQGMTEMLRALSDQELYDRSMVLPLELVSLISMKLLNDITPGLPGGIRETYSSYLDSIESDITTKSPDRSHKSSLGLFEQEVSIIQWIINYQTSIFKTMERAARVANRVVDTPGPGPSSSLHPGRASQPSLSASRYRIGGPPPPPPPPNHLQTTYHHLSAFTSPPPIQTIPDPEIRAAHGFRDLFLQEIRNYLDERTRGFADLRNYAIGLGEINTNNLATTKDRQERAIYAFTIVTVNFLPLSSIASIFGMNSSDVRDMDVGQWAYWATAVPVTILVIFFGLLWTDELGNVGKWLVDAARSLRVGVVGGDKRDKEWERLEKDLRVGDDGRAYSIARSSGRRGGERVEREYAEVTFRPRRRRTIRV